MGFIEKIYRKELEKIVQKLEKIEKEAFLYYETREYLVELKEFLSFSNFVFDRKKAFFITIKIISLRTKYR